jgi:putative hemolysin
MTHPSLRWGICAALAIVACTSPSDDPIATSTTGSATSADATTAADESSSGAQDGGDVETGSSSGGSDSNACVSNSWWTMGNEESPDMRPGGDCIACHAEEQEGPAFLVAGTVYSAPHEPDDCNGVGGLTVELTGADGAVHTLTTRSSGNFFAEMGEFELMLPYKAAVIDGDQRREMVGEQLITNCASCHTQEGLVMAPGRIIAP